MGILSFVDKDLLQTNNEGHLNVTGLTLERLICSLPGDPEEVFPCSDVKRSGCSLKLKDSRFH